MKLSFVIELLLIFLLIAFAASRVIDARDGRAAKKQSQKQDDTSNRYCSCSTDSCNCCREFTLPVVPIKGPGCATLQYLQGDNMALSMKFGDRVLTNTTISGKKPKPVCMRLPGGFSKFCGRVYGISRDPEAFHACLGLEIRALDDIEAALRLSCFRFSPEGLRVEPGKPIPVDDEEEDEDDYGFGDDDDDDDDEEEEEEEETEEETEEEDDDDDDDLEAAGVGDDNEISADYAGFSILGDLLGFDDESVESPPKKKPNKKTPTSATIVATDNKAPQPVAIVVHVSPIHNTPVVIETVTHALTNNKVMDKLEVTTAAPTKSPHKSPPKVQSKPTRTPAAAPSKPPAKVTAAAPTTATPVATLVSVEAFKPTTSTEFTVSVMQDGQALQPTEEVGVTEKDEMVEFTTQPVEEEDMQYGEDDAKDENVPVMANEVVMAEEGVKEEDAEEEMAEEEMNDEEEEGEEVDIGVVKEEETQSDEDNMAATEIAPVSMDMETITENVKVAVVQVTSEAAPTVSAVVPTVSGVTGDRDEDEEEADSVVEEVEEAVATVIGQGEEDEEDDEDDEDDDDEDEEADEGEKDGEKEEEDDEDYDLGLEDDDDEEDEKVEATTTEKAAETSTKAGVRRWRRRRNRLDHIFWH